MCKRLIIIIRAFRAGGFRRGVREDSRLDLKVYTF